MKRSLVFFFATFAFSIAITAPAAEVPAEAVAPETMSEVSQCENSNFSNMVRGITNIGTCFVEIPRCILYQNSRVPFWGFIDGAVEGCGMTAMRAFGGVTDVLFLGFDPGLIYNQTLRDYVWESRWIAHEK